MHKGTNLGKEDQKLETEKTLGRTDYFQFWLEKAQKQAPQKNFPDEFLVEALSIVKSAFNKDWIVERIKGVDVKEELRKQNRDVPHLIATPGESQISSLLELAIYLKRTLYLPNFSRVLEMMKQQNTFNSAFLQLSYAYRFSLFGATNIEFEPAVDAGKSADIFFNWESTEFLCECYSPKTIGPAGYLDFMAYNADKVLRSASALRKKVNVLVRLQDDLPSTQAARISLQKSCLNILKEIPIGEHRKVTESQWEIEIWERSKMSNTEEEKILASLAPELTCGLNHTLVNKADLSSMMDGTKVPKITVGRFQMAVAKESESWDAIVEDLSNKIEAKIVQLRKKDRSPKGILIVETPYAAFYGLDESAIGKHLGRIKGKLQAHSNVSGLILSYRAWNSRYRHTYTGYSIDTKDDPVIKTLFGRLAEIENSHDILGDYK